MHQRYIIAATARAAPGAEAPPSETRRTGAGPADLVRLAAGAILILLAAPASASTDEQIWTGAAATQGLSGRWRLSEEAIARFSDTRGGLYEVESTALLGYRLGKRVTLWAGYTHDPNYAAGRFTVMEHRGREQITLDGIAVGPGRLNLRVRLEQRWRDGLPGLAWRLRPFVRYSLPLLPRLSLNLSHESFVNLNKTGFQSVGSEERMRNLAALATPIGRHITVEFGFLQQRGFVHGGPDTKDNSASLMLSFAY